MGTLLDRRRVVEKQKMVEIEYLESTGTQYINTGIKLLENATGDITFSCKGIIYSNTTRQGALINASREISPYQGFVIRRNVSDQQVQIAWGPQWTNDWIINQEFEIIHTHSLVNQAHDWPLAFFSSLKDVTTPQRFCTGRLYYFKTIINDVTVVDFIPVRIGQTGYVYDKVSGELFSNAGTGDFILGPDKT